MKRRRRRPDSRRPIAGHARIRGSRTDQRRSPRDIRADIYSLGCTLYCLLTGPPPFQAENLYDLLQTHHSMDALPLNLARPAVPFELAALVAKKMAKEPERRFQTPRDVAQARLPFFKKAHGGDHVGRWSDSGNV